MGVYKVGRCVVFLDGVIYHPRIVRCGEMFKAWELSFIFYAVLLIAQKGSTEPKIGWIVSTSFVWGGKVLTFRRVAIERKGDKERYLLPI